jgi:AsmA-like C-terminal region/Protein of unknown function
MRELYIKSRFSVLSRTWAALHLHWRALMAARSAEERETAEAKRGLARVLRCERPWVRRCVHGGLAMTGLAMMACGLLWWRLASGPLTLDMVTPWLTSAIEQRFGGNHRVEVGGTQLERDDDGRTALRLRDVVVRGPNGAVVASAPKAEVGISGANLFLGQLQAIRLSLIGATMALRVDTNGQVSVSAGTEKSPSSVDTPFVVGTVPPSRMALASADHAPGSQDAAAAGQDIFAALLSWLDGINALGLDGRDLTEIGLKNGSVVVDDQRSGKQWSFDNINLSLTRPKEGGVAFTLTSNGADGPWSLTATVTPHEDGRRAIEAVVRDISPKDIMLALRANGSFEADMPLSAILRAEIGPDGTMLMGEGRILAGAGFIGNGDDPKNRVLIDEAALQWRWDAANHALVMPLELQSGGNQIKLIAQLEAPHEAGGPWALNINRGMIVLGTADRTRETPLVLDRVLVRGRIDPTKRRIDIDQGELGGLSAGLAFSGGFDNSGADPRLTFGIAANRMSVAAFKRLWPVFISPDIRNWVVDHVQTGTIDRVVIAANATIPEFRPGGPPMPEDGISIDIAANATLRPVETLPAIRDADISVRTTGRTAKVTVGRSTIDLPSGKKLTMSNGTFDIADTSVKPSAARVKMRVDGAVDAAAELMGMEPLSSAATVPADPATLRGGFVAQVNLGWPLMPEPPKGAFVYQVDADITNFSADKLVRGLKADAASLKFTANPQGVQVKGDVKIGNAMVTADYRKPRGDGDAEVRALTTLDDAARARMGFDLGGTLTGSVPMKISGRIGGGDRDNRFAIDADLTQSKIVDLLPGWNKAAGKPSRATFVLIEKQAARRFEDLVLEGGGALVKGSAEVDADGDVTAVNFPTFVLSDGDKASLRADRASDGTLRVTMRGDVYDGRGFIKALMSGPSDQKPSKSAYDFDLDIKLGTVAGFHGETLRGLDLRLSRRAGQIRSLAFNSKLGRDAPFTADLRGHGGRQVVALNTEDAGALFRFIDLYPRMEGGTMGVEIDPPTVDHAPQNGIVAIRGFTVRGEPALNRVAAGTPGDGLGHGYISQAQGVEFSRMRIDFTRAPGRLTIRDGVVSGPAVGATFDGNIDFQHDDVRMRGTFVPAYALNNLAAQVVPIIGPIISGGKNEGLFGVTFEVTGSPSAMTLRPNPISPLAPGFLRKIFEFRRLEDDPVAGGAAAR